MPCATSAAVAGAGRARPASTMAERSSTRHDAASSHATGVDAEDVEDTGDAAGGGVVMGANDGDATSDAGRMTRAVERGSRDAVQPSGALAALSAASPVP